MKLLILLCFSFIFIGSTTADDQAVDFSQPLTSSQMHCVASNFFFVTVRAYMSTNNGMIDNNVCNTYQILSENHDIWPGIYMIPSGNGSKNGNTQVNEMINGLGGQCKVSNNVNSFHLWITNPQDWSSDTSKNVKLIQDIIQGANKSRWYVRSIYTNEADWKAITNNVNNQVLANYDLPLWWATAPKTGEAPQNTSNFKPFGGWSPNDVQIIQYQKNIPSCGLSCNTSVYVS